MDSDNDLTSPEEITPDEGASSQEANSDDAVAADDAGGNPLNREAEPEEVPAEATPDGGRAPDGSAEVAPLVASGPGLSKPARRKRLSLPPRALLLVILILGLALRLYGVNWDDKQHAHPDERWIAMVASDLEWPVSLSQALDPRTSPINPLWCFRDNRPRSFAYGHLPLYLITATASLLEKVAAWAPRAAWFPPLATALSALARVADYDQINLLGRVLSALADTGVIWLIYLVGKRLYGRWAGLLAAAFVALTVSHIQLSHYAAFDTFATFFIVLTVYGALRVWQQGRWRDVLLAGGAAGLAVSSKFSALPVLLPVALGCLARVLSQARAEAGEAGVPPKLSAERLTLLLRLGASCLAVAILVFALTSPYALLDGNRFLQQIGEQGSMVRGTSDLPYTRQYRPTKAFVYQIEQMVRWGMGWPLGLLALAGLVYVVARSVADLRRARIRWGDVVVLGWVIPYFAITGSFMVKFMRYMLPLLPFFSLMGAALIVDLWKAAGDRAPVRARSLRLPWRHLAALIAAGVLGASLVYAVAFAGIYGREHSWNAASRWIYANVPDGSVIAVEHWDDNLPKSMPEPGLNPGSHGYRHTDLPMYEPDTRSKFATVQRVLQGADYVALASNRLYRTIPALPARYPVSTRYYELLFAEKLGFERVATFTSYPRIGGWEINDDAADESFTVYDHPKAIIFRKTRDLTAAEFDALFAQAFEVAPQWEFTPQETVDERPQKSLLLDEPVESLPVVRGIGWNTLASQNTVAGVLFWWLVLECIGVLALPLTFVVFRNLGDRGYALSKALGWLLIGLLNWWLASLRILTNALPTILLCAALLGLLSFWLWRRHRAAMSGFLRAKWRTILINEAVFGLAFLFFAVIRVLNPDLWQPWFGGEKFMEMAFLNAILKSPYFPPYDPYYSGGYLNYYYYGQYLASVLIKLAGVTSSVGFNLAIPTLFALTVSNAFCVVTNMWRGAARRWAAGLIGAISLALFGNLTAITQVVDGWLRAGATQMPGRGIPLVSTVARLGTGIWATATGQVEMPAFDYWHLSTRVIPYTINEFPLFSFLFADLHPHMIGIPFTVLVLALLLDLVRGTRGDAQGEDSVRGYVVRWLMLPVALGSLGAINTWDLPTYIGMASLAIIFHTYRLYAKYRPAIAITRIVAVTGLSLALYYPFYHSYQAISVGVGLVPERSPVAPFLTIWGVFLFVLAAYSLASWGRNRARVAPLRYARALLGNAAYLPHVLDLHAALVRRPSLSYVVSRYALGLSLLLAVVLAALGQWTLALLWPLVVIAALPLFRDDATPEDAFAHLLIFTGVLVLLGCEIVYMKDFLGGGDWRRMNTLFKFYTQVWVIFGLAMGYALPKLWGWTREWRSRGWRWVWRSACAFLVFCALLYPVLGIPARVRQRFPMGSPPVGTLDGMAYMSVGIYTWPDENHPIELEYDYEAIRWLQENVEGTPVVAEGRIDYYREGGMRVSSFTGLPALLGAHQGEQRYDWQVGSRDGLARDFFNTRDVRRAQDIADQLAIRFVYVGQLERSVYDAAGLAKFDEMVERGILQVPFENAKVRIYRFVAQVGKSSLNANRQQLAKNVPRAFDHLPSRPDG